jgi:hypothetical protein
VSVVEDFTSPLRHSSSRWTSERIDLLKQLRADGLSTTEIGRELGVTRGAIAGKLDRLGLTRPEGERWKGNVSRPAKQKKPRKPRAPRSKWGAWLSGPGGAPTEALPVPPVEAPTSAPIHFWQHNEDTQCCMPLGGGLLYCSEPREHIGARVPHSFCRFHGKETTTPRRQRG